MTALFLLLGIWLVLAGYSAVLYVLVELEAGRVER